MSEDKNLQTLQAKSSMSHLNEKSNLERQLTSKEKEFFKITTYVVKLNEIIKLMLCSTWNYCMKKVVLKTSVNVPIVKGNETFRE